MMLAPPSARERPNPEKRSLAAILRTHGPLSVSDAIDVALDICDELANAHANGIVHGDLGLHRVRLYWPRSQKAPLEIFALDEDDSAAFAFRASPVAPLAAPEQRAGRLVDQRADVWAVGAILHWMLAGRPPASGVTEESLVGVPGVVAATIESCLAVDPAQRPQSVDEFAQAIGSYASSPPQRFEALARRRETREGAMKVRAVRGNVSDVLGRLDDAAFKRELVAASDGPTHTSVARSVAERILDPRATGTSVVTKASVVAKLPPPPRLPQVVAPPSPMEPEFPVEKTVPLPSPLGAAPRRADSLAPVSTGRSSQPALLLTPDLRAHRTTFIAMGSAAAVAFVIVVAVRLLGGGAAPTSTVAAERQPPVVAPPAVVTAVPAPVETAAASAPVPTFDLVPVVTPASLPAFRPAQALPTVQVRASESARAAASAAPAASASAEPEPEPEPKAEEPTSDDAP